MYKRASSSSNEGVHTGTNKIIQTNSTVHTVQLPILVASLLKKPFVALKVEQSMFAPCSHDVYKEMLKYTFQHHACRMIRYVDLSISIFVSIIIIYGCILRRTLQHGNECEMTWSVVRFISLPEPDDDTESNSKPIFPFRLLKFTDGRDKRFNHLLDYDKPDDNDRNTYQVIPNINWCESGNESRRKPGHIVLYVPGHEGHYQQARSLGAHGVGMTRHSISPEVGRDIVDKLWDGTTNGSSKNLDDFVFDVYAVDFFSEGSLLHGSRLFAQSEFITIALERIMKECKLSGENLDRISIVAHSVGGLVARKAVLEVNQKRLKRGEPPLVKDIITLASPHSSIPYTFEPSVNLFYQTLLEAEIALEAENGESSYTLLSISGGLRDELIPPSSCEISKNHSISILASEIMHPKVSFRGLGMGMDHQAIVWCHGLLSAVREVIHTISLPNAESLNENISQFINKKKTFEDACDFRCRNLEKDELMVNQYGWRGAFVIKTSMLWNFRSAAYLYGMNGGLHLVYICICCSFTKSENRIGGFVYVCVPIMSSLLLFLFNDDLSIGLGSTIVLSFNAMNFYYIILHGLFPILSWLLMRVLSNQPDNASAKYETLLHAGKAYLRQQTWTAFAIGLLVSFLLFICSPLQKSVLVFNAMSVGSLVFIVTVAMLGLNILHLGSWPESRTRQLNGKRSLASMLLVVFPLFSIGKVAFAISLFSESGQQKASPYMDFENTKLDKFCNESNELACYLRFELVRFIFVVCLPIYAVALGINCRAKIGSIIELKKDL